MMSSELKFMWNDTILYANIYTSKIKIICYEQLVKTQVAQALGSNYKNWVEHR